MLTPTFTASLAAQRRNDLIADAEAARRAAQAATGQRPSGRRRPRLLVLRRVFAPRTA